MLRLLKNRVMSDYVYTIFVRQSKQTVCPSHHAPSLPSSGATKDLKLKGWKSLEKRGDEKN